MLEEPGVRRAVGNFIAPRNLFSQSASQFEWWAPRGTKSFCQSWKSSTSQVVVNKVEMLRTNLTFRDYGRPFLDGIKQNASCRWISETVIRIGFSAAVSVRTLKRLLHYTHKVTLQEYRNGRDLKRPYYQHFYFFLQCIIGTKTKNFLLSAFFSPLALMLFCK